MSVKDTVCLILWIMISGFWMMRPLHGYKRGCSTIGQLGGASGVDTWTLQSHETSGARGVVDFLSWTLPDLHGGPQPACHHPSIYILQL